MITTNTSNLEKLAIKTNTTPQLQTLAISTNTIKVQVEKQIVETLKQPLISTDCQTVFCSKADSIY